MKKFSFLFSFIITFASVIQAKDYPHYALALTERLVNNPADYLDLSPNDVDRHMYLWESTLDGSSETDSPYEGNSYSKFTVKSAWCGLGMISDLPIDFSTFAHNNFVLHFAIKSTANIPLFIKLESGGYPGNGVVKLTGKYNFTRDNNWHVIEIPLSAFFAAGVRWNGNVSNKNYFTIISEKSTPGQVFCLDDVYFHSGTRLDGTTYTDTYAEPTPTNPNNYYVAYETLNTENSVDLRPDNVTRHLYVWENTATEGPASGDAYEGGQFASLKLSATLKWFGFGVVSDNTVDFSPFTKQKYTLQVALRTTSLMPLFIKLEGLNGTTAVCYLSGKYDFKRDDQWHLIQIPMADFLNQGLDWNGTISKNNYFSLISEKSESGAVINFDAIRFIAGEPEAIVVDPVTPPAIIPERILIATEYGFDPTDPKILDLRPNNVDKFMYVWENTATGVAQDGLAFEGGENPNLKINSAWFGFGFVNTTPVDFSFFAFKNYILHFAVKTNAIMPLVILLEGRGEARLNLSGNYAVARDGEWHEVNIPMSEFFNQGLVWDSQMANKNFFSLYSELSKPGDVFAFDDIYYYLDPVQSVKNTNQDIFKIFQDGKTLRIANQKNQQINIYNLQGVNMYKGVSQNISIEKFPKGVYIVKVGSATNKFIIR